MHFTEEQIKKLLEDPHRWVNYSELWKDDIIKQLCKDWLETQQRIEDMKVQIEGMQDTINSHKNIYR